MGPLRRFILSLALMAGLVPAISFAAAPPPVPALPDTQRLTSYSITSSTCACAINFALYGDATDYQNWISVFLNGVQVNFNDATFGWTITSPTGPLATIPRPITDAVLTFNSAQTGTVQIVGARRPRRASQFQENKGVAARDLNQTITDITATLREMWDKSNGSSPGPTFTDSANVNFLQLGTGAALRSVQSVLRESIRATDFGVKCDGTTDDSVNAQAAITAAAGRPVVFPAGTCVIGTALTYNTTSASTFTQGLQIFGQGREKTIFDNRVVSGFLFSSDTSANNFFQSGVLFKDFKITTTTNPSASSGIKLHRTANAKFENIQIAGITGDGIDIPASAGDADASFIVEIDRVRMDAVAGWCVNLNAPSGGYFGSNLRVVNSSFNGCGTASGSVPPTSGGMQYKGLIAQIENSAFTVNHNVSLYIQGLDTSLQVTIDGVDFENTISSVLPAVYVDAGLRGFLMTNSECLNNDSNIGQGCVWFNSTSAIIGNVLIDKTEVRATSANNPYVAFQITGANAIIDTIRAHDIYWQTFDTAGQLRFSGFLFDQCPGQVRLSVPSLNAVQINAVGLGAAIPLRLKGASGEFVCVQVPAGGISATPGPLAASTTYNVYAFNSALVNAPYAMALETNLTASTTDTTSGVQVKTGDSTRTFVGTATTDSGGAFQTPLGLVQSWYAPIIGWAGQFFATATNDNAGAGKVGEYIVSNVAFGSAVTLTTAISANMTSISLTAGDWDVMCSISFNIAGTTNVTTLLASISATSATLDNQVGALSNYRTPPQVPGGTMNQIVGPFRVSLASTTTYFCVAQSTFTVAGNGAYGQFRARRVR